MAQLVKQELRARLSSTQVCLAPSERVRPIEIQLSPISLLPNEVLIHIFQHGLDQVPRSARDLPFPAVVAGVCRSWKAVALRTPELWTHVFLTSATPVNHFHRHLERSGKFGIDITFCHWPPPRYGGGVNFSQAFLESIIIALHSHAYRLRSLSTWDVSDAVVCAVMKGMTLFQTPCLTSVSVKANHTAHTHYYELRDFYLLPFLSGGAPSLTHLDIDHFPIETLRTRTDWPFNVHHLTSLTLRTRECPMLGLSLPPYLIEFPALCALLRSTPNLATLALHGPVIEPDEDFPLRPPPVTLPLLETLIIHRHDAGVRYHCELLSVLVLPALKRLEIPWRDDLTVELPHADRAAEYLLDGGKPLFASVETLYLHDSTFKRQMPTRTFIKAFQNVKEVVLGGTDVANFAATLRGFVHPCSTPSDRVGGRHHCRERGGDSVSEGVLDDGAWTRVKKVVLKEPEMARWKGWVRGFEKWLAAAGHVGRVLVEIRARDDELDDRAKVAFQRGLNRLRKHAWVVAT